MGISVELNFDAESENYVRYLWQKLAQEHLGDDLMEVHYTPHLSLGVWGLPGQPTEDMVPMIVEVVKRFSREIHDFPLHFSVLGQFNGKEGVVFSGPVFTQELWNAHAYLHHFTENLRSRAQLQYLPNCWVPHCTLGHGLSIPQKSRAMDILNREFKPFTARINRVSMVSYYPIQEHIALELNSL